MVELETEGCGGNYRPKYLITVGEKAGRHTESCIVALGNLLDRLELCERDVEEQICGYPRASDRGGRADFRCVRFARQGRVRSVGGP